MFSHFLKNPLLKKSLAVSAIAVTAGLGSLPAMSAIAPFSANYNFSYDKYSGTATRTLALDGNEWVYTMSANVGKLASAGQSAVFVNQNGNITPLAASTRYKIFGVTSATDLTFDQKNRQYSSKYKGKTKNIPMSGTALDDLSLEMQIREDLKAGKFRGNYVLAGRNKADSVPFTKSATTKINVPAGTFDVVRIDRVHDDENRSTSFWLAPSLDYLPVKVVQNDDGKVIQMSLTKINR